jgi:hypothetical protein
MEGLMKNKLLCLIVGVLVVTASGPAGTPVINGILDPAAGYILLTDPTWNPATRTGFGPAIDACQIWYTDDAANLYFFIAGHVNPATDDGILFLLDTTAEAGKLPGVLLGGPPGGHCLGTAANPSWAMDFEVDHAWVGNPGFSGVNYWIDAKNYVGPVTAGFSGNCGMVGVPMPDAFVPGVIHAFDNVGLFGVPTTSGWEIQIPRAALGGASTTSFGAAFAIVVSSTAWFSDDSAQHLVGAWGPGNPGGNPDFNVLSPMPQNTLPFQLPVTLSRFVIE